MPQSLNFRRARPLAFATGFVVVIVSFAVNCLHSSSPATAVLTHSHWSYSPTAVSRPINWSNEKSTTLRQALFPGYSTKSVTGLEWERFYFSQPFLSDRRLNLVPNLPPDQVVATPWLSCVPLVQREGADILVVGNSETYRAIDYEAFRQAAEISPSSRAAFCFRSLLLPESLPALFTALAPNATSRAANRPIHLLLIGVSLSWLVPEQEGRQAASAQQLKEIIEFQKNTPDSFTRGSVLTHAITAAFSQPHQNRLPFFSLPPQPGYLSQWPQEKNFRLWARDLPKLDSGELIPRPYYQLTSAGQPADCSSWHITERTLNNLFAAARRTAKTIYVFLPPLSASGNANYDKCLKQRLQEYFHTQADIHFHDANEINSGLKNRHFTEPTLIENLLHFDLNHVNAEGARIFSQQLGVWVRESQ